MRWQDGSAHVEIDDVERGRPEGCVLLIHSSAAVRKAVSLQLEDWGFHVSQASGAEQGLVQFDPATIEAVVVSVALDGSGGLAVLDEVRNRAPHIPVIMIVGSPTQDDAIGAMRRGAFDFIVLDEIHIIRQLVHGEREVDDRPDPLKAAIQRAVNQTRLQGFGEELNNQLAFANETLAGEQRRLQDALDELHRTQAQLLRAEKAAGLAGVSHGVGNAINNPLVAVKANFDLLSQWIRLALDIPGTLELPLGDEVPALIDDCSEGLHRIKQTVEALARFANNRHVMFEAVDAEALLHNLPPYVDEELADRADIEIACDLDTPLRGSRLLLQQALLSVLNNSAEACAGGGRIALRATRAGDRARLEVIDNGEGIPCTDLSKVTDPFFTTRLERKAHGLGLSLAQELVSRLEGVLEINSEEGSGTTVAIELPLWQ